MTDENATTTDETPPVAPAAAEASGETPIGDEPTSAPVTEQVTEPAVPVGESVVAMAPPEEVVAEPTPEPAPETVDEPVAEIPQLEAPAEESTEPETPVVDSAPEAPEEEPTPVAESPAEEAKSKPKKPRKSKTIEAESEPEHEPAAATASDESPVAAEPSSKRWYAVKVQSGREESIKAAIERKVKIENLETYFGQIVIPVEEVNEKKKVKVKVKDKKTGEIETTTQERNVVKKIKKFPGYIFAEVEFNDEILYVFRETSGVGDFVGIPARRGQGGERLAPAPMTDAEVQSMLTGVPVPGDPRKGPKKTVVKLDFEKGDKVRIKNGAFAGHEAEVKSITEAKDPTDSPKVTVIVTMWGRPVDVDLDYWEVDKA